MQLSAHLLDSPQEHPYSAVVAVVGVYKDIASYGARKNVALDVSEGVCAIGARNCGQEHFGAIEADHNRRWKVRRLRSPLLLKHVRGYTPESLAHAYSSKHNAWGGSY